MTLPLRSGGQTITILHEVQDAYGDKTWVDGETITGCMSFPSFSSSGRITWRLENTGTGGDVIMSTRTLYMPFGTKVGPTDRVLVHPDGVDSITDITDEQRHEGTYDILGDPMDWRNGLTGWAPCTEAALVRVL